MKIELFDTFEEAEQKMAYYSELLSNNISIFSSYIIYNDRFGIHLPKNHNDELCSGDLVNLTVTQEEQDELTDSGCSYFHSILEDRQDKGIETPYPTPF